MDNLPQIIIPSYMANQLYTSAASAISNNRKSLIQVNINDVMHKDFGKQSMREIQTIPHSDNFTYIMSCRHISQYQMESTNAGIVIDTMGGKKNLSVEEYLERIHIDGPNIVIAMADEISWKSSKKRLSKAWERTLKWFMTMKSSSVVDWEHTKLYGVVLSDYRGNYETMTLELLSAGVQGIVIGGACMGEDEDQLLSAIDTIRHLVPASLPVVVQGISSIPLMLKCVKHGATMIASDISIKLTAAGRAITVDSTSMHDSWEYDPISSQDAATSTTPSITATINDHILNTGKKRAHVDEDGNIQLHDDADHHPGKKRKLEIPSTSNQQVHATSQDIISSTSSYHGSINLRDEKYRRDTRPLMQACSCLSCRSHTRAYIHHLLKVKELLGEILLYQHNQHQLQQLFDHMHLRQETNQLASWLDDVISKLQV